MKTIIVDMDHTMNLFSPHFCNWILSRGYSIVPEKVDHDWDLASWIDCPKKEGNEVVKDIFCTNGFWIQIPIMRDVPKVMKKLNDKYKIIIGTVPFDAAKNCESEKIEWTNRYLPFIRRDQISFEKDKWTISADYIIDDKPETLQKFPGVKICMGYPYNEHVEVDFRVHNWIEIANIFKV